LKTVLLKIAAAAAGITLALCIAAACVFWYETKPKPPKPWNTTALTASDPPSFVVYGQKLHIHFRYSVQNHTGNDYSLDKRNQFRLVGRYADGSLTAPLENEELSIEDTAFVPANQTGMIVLEVKAVLPLAQGTNQSDDAYHEQNRALLNTAMGGLEGFAIFDEENRYQINLPKWRADKPADKPGAKPQVKP
jgi:hypothetical protein